MGDQPKTMKLKTNTELEQLMHDTNMESGEVITLASFANEIVRLEQDNGLILADNTLRHAWYEAADSFVQSMIGNEYDTPLSEYFLGAGETAEEVQAYRIARWNAMLPSSARRQHIASLEV